MGDQLTLQTIGILLTALTVSIAAIYYTLTLRYTRRNQELQLETRQAQLFMSLYETYRTPQFRKQWLDVMNLEWKDWDDFKEKYSLYTMKTNPAVTDWQSQMSFYDGIGLLVRKGLIDLSFVDEQWYHMVVWTWEKNQPLVDGFRRSITPWERYFRESKEETGDETYPKIYRNFEYLYNELMKYTAEHPEIKH